MTSNRTGFALHVIQKTFPRIRTLFFFKFPSVNIISVKTRYGWKYPASFWTPKFDNLDVHCLSRKSFNLKMITGERSSQKRCEKVFQYPRMKSGGHKTEKSRWTETGSLVAVRSTGIQICLDKSYVFLSSLFRVRGRYELLGPATPPAHRHTVPGGSIGVLPLLDISHRCRI